VGRSTLDEPATLAGPRSGLPWAIDWLLAPSPRMMMSFLQRRQVMRSVRPATFSSGI